MAEYSFRTAARIHGRVYGGPKWTVSPVYEGMLKEEMDEASERHPEVPYSPVLIDATYAGLISGAADAPLVIPALNRDGDCLSDLVMPMFGSIAGAESVLLAFDDEYEPKAVMAEAPHGTAPALQGKDIANPMAMILAGAAVLHYAGTLGYEGCDTASRAIYESVLEAVATGVRTPDLGGHATTSEFTGEVIGARAHEDRHLGFALGARRGREKATPRGPDPRAANRVLARLVGGLLRALGSARVQDRARRIRGRRAWPRRSRPPAPSCVRSRGYAPFAPELAWSRGLLRLPREVVMDTWRMAMLLVRHFVRGDPIKGCFRIVHFAAGSDDDPRAEARRTVAEWLGCVSPNTYVIGIDERHQVAVVHQLIRDELPPELDPSQ